jgi:hypothetical protein
MYWIAEELLASPRGILLLVLVCVEYLHDTELRMGINLEGNCSGLINPLQLHLPGGTEEDLGDLQSGQSVSCATVSLVTLLIQVQTVRRCTVGPLGEDKYVYKPSHRFQANPKH